MAESKDKVVINIPRRLESVLGSNAAKMLERINEINKNIYNKLGFFLAKAVESPKDKAF